GAFGAGFGPSKKLAQCKETISLASDAVSNRRQVEITYKALSTSQETRRRVDPYRVWAMNGALYLIGLCHLRNEVRTFAIDRITALDVLQESFRAPKDFSLSDYLQSAFRVMRGEPKVIKVRFSPGAAQVVRERIWHPSQEIREKPDGSVILTLEAPINYEVTSWILGFGSAAKVLKPQSLQDKILRELEASLTRYSSWSHSRTKVAPAKKIVAALS
ncbi:MAG: WYL domain-containing protein, partial [Deltaproteobacteria bacterium]|nr:WYL domain-containing protein [Deltaproteobacteria bacterium]